MNRHYLDHAASSPLRPEAIRAMADRAGMVGNPSALHTAGRRARADLEESREQIADLLGAHPSEVVFTSGGSEANSIAVLGTLARSSGHAQMVISAVEHPSVAESRSRLAGRVTVVGVDHDGELDSDGLNTALESPTALVSLMAVNNETGRRFDPTTVVDRVHAVGAVLHSDWVQAVGHGPLDFAGSRLDLASISAHKVGGPVGIGVLLVRRGFEPASIGLGGGQEAKIRSGTMTVALAAGAAAALAASHERLEAELARLGGLRERLVGFLTGLDGVRVNAAGPMSPHIVNATFESALADDLLLLLDRVGIDVSTGSACTAGVHRPSEVLLAMGRSDAEALSSLRFSFGWSTTDADLDALVAALPAVVQTARAARRVELGESGRTPSMGSRASNSGQESTR